MTPLIGAFCKFVAALCSAVMAYRKWREESRKHNEEKEQGSGSKDSE